MGLRCLPPLVLRRPPLVRTLRVYVIWTVRGATSGRVDSLFFGVAVHGGPLRFLSSGALGSCAPTAANHCTRVQLFFFVRGVGVRAV